MTRTYKNVYVQDAATIAGPYEAKGPLHSFFDKTYDDLYEGEKSFEQAEVHLMRESIQVLLKKVQMKQEQVDLMIAGDLLNQITSSCYAVLPFQIPFLGIYSACATSVEGMILASEYIENKTADFVICSTSSHNMGSEKQFRNPTEYGAPKPKTSTFTATGGASILLGSKKTDIQVTASTIGVVQDLGQKDPLHMGAVMAPAAADTIYRHLSYLKESPEDYDLILTGDLGCFGKEILKDYLEQEHHVKLGTNYNDCGVLLYDLENQKDVHAGGSGPVCSALVNYGYILQQLREGTLKKVLLVATGALFSPTFAFQKQPILSIAHAITLERVKLS